MMARMAGILTLILLSFNAHALDTEIRVLIVDTAQTRKTFGEYDNINNLTAVIDQMVAVWNVTSDGDIDPLLLSPITMTIANTKEVSGDYEIPQLDGPAMTATDDLTTWGRLTSTEFDTQQVRNAYDADIVIAIVDSNLMRSCGIGPTRWWNDHFIPAGNFKAKLTGPEAGLDRRGAENSYMVVISDAVSCFSRNTAINDSMINILAHEIGHLFGGGHDLEPTQPGRAPSTPRGWYLYDDSHGYVSVLTLPFFNLTLRLKTVLSRRDIDIAKCMTGQWCTQMGVYSEAAGFNNVGTIKKTDASVANYRPIPSDPPVVACNLSTPTNVRGRLLEYCDTNDDVSRHELAWDDSCPEETVVYNGAASPNGPFGPYYIVGTSLASPTPTWNRIDVWWKIRACSATGCTGLSDSYYFAKAYCFDTPISGPIP